MLRNLYGLNPRWLALLLFLSTPPSASPLTNQRTATRINSGVASRRGAVACRPDGVANYPIAPKGGRLDRFPLFAETEDGIASPDTRDSDSTASDEDFKWSQIRARESDTFKWSVVREKESEIKRLKFRLNEVNGAIENSERRAEEAERRLTDLEKESEVERAVNKGLVAQIKAQFEKEREKLTEELRSISDELLKTKEESSEELARVKFEVEEREASLESKIVTLESSLQKAEDFVASTKKRMEQERSGRRAMLRREREKAEQMVKAIKSLAHEEKRALEKENWDLESKLDRMKLELVAAQKETAEIKASRAALEEKLRQVEKSLTEKIDELEQRIQADEMFYARSRQVTKDKLASVAAKFQAKLAERESDFETRVQAVKDEAAGQLAAMAKKAKRDRIAIYQEKYEALADSRAEMDSALRDAETRLIMLLEESNARIQRTEQNAERRIESVEQMIEPKLSEAEEKLALLMEESDAKIQQTEQNAELMIESVEESMMQKISEAEAMMVLLKEEYEAKIQQTERNAEEKIASMELTMNQKLADAKAEVEQAKTSALLEKDKALSQTMRDDARKLEVVRLTLLRRITSLMDDFLELKKENDKMKRKYEGERNSFRKLVGLSWKLAKERMSNIRKRLFKRGQR